MDNNWLFKYFGFLGIVALSLLFLTQSFVPILICVAIGWYTMIYVNGLEEANDNRKYKFKRKRVRKPVHNRHNRRSFGFAGNN